MEVQIWDVILLLRQLVGALDKDGGGFLEFTVNRPLRGHDEDAPPYADEKMLVVCDGLGGGGQNTYIIDGEKRTSAYLGSRRLSLAFQEWCLQYYDLICENMQNPRFLIEDLKKYIVDTLNAYVSEKKLKNIIRGKSMQMLPSTLAAIIYKQNGEWTEVLVVSAGDSRAFILTPENGLQQISKDDVFEDVDAFEKSATMTNNISADKDFYINYVYYKMPPKCILFVCTDGCFDYISSPMELEYRLEFAISKCTDIFDNDRDNLGEYIGNILLSNGLKDDCTMAGAIIGYKEQEEFKNKFLQRMFTIQSKYRNPCINYDNKSLKRQSEVATQLESLNKEINVIKSEIDSDILDYIVEAFLLDIGVNEYTDDEKLQKLKFWLQECSSYRTFVSDMIENEKKQLKLKEEQEVEYIGIHKQIQQMFKIMRFEQFSNNTVADNLFINLFSVNSSRNRVIKDYKNLQREIIYAENEYDRIINKFSNEFNNFKELKMKQYMQYQENLPIFELFVKLQGAYKEYIRLSRRFEKCKENLKSFYLEQDITVEQEFASAWKTRFKDYIGCSQYDEICSSYDRCIELQTEIQMIVPLTLEEKTETFKKYLKHNLSDILNKIKADSCMMYSLCRTQYVELENMQKQMNELKKYASEFEKKKYALWIEYKTSYELFYSGMGGMV